MLGFSIGAGTTYGTTPTNKAIFSVSGGGYTVTLNNTSYFCGWNVADTAQCPNIPVIGPAMVNFTGLLGISGVITTDSEMT